MSGRIAVRRPKPTLPLSRTRPPPAAPLGFALEREIDIGSVGIVSFARQQGLNRPVALKTIRPGTTFDLRALIRSLAEAEAVAAVRHPNVVEVYSFGEHSGCPFLAVEYRLGGDLTSLVVARKLPPAELAESKTARSVGGDTRGGVILRSFLRSLLPLHERFERVVLG